jgi:hypothetical protein
VARRPRPAARGRSRVHLLTHGASCVLQYVVRADRRGDLERIMAVVDCVVVMPACADPRLLTCCRAGLDRASRAGRSLRGGGAPPTGGGSRSGRPPPTARRTARR